MRPEPTRPIARLLTIPPATRDLVHARDAWRCQACARSGDLNVHHRQARGMGGRHGTAAAAAHAPGNLLTLCGSGVHGCHGWATQHPDHARTLGWTVPTWQEDPGQLPVYTCDGMWRQWRLLRPDGTWVPWDAPEPAGIGVLDLFDARCHHLGP